MGTYKASDTERMARPTYHGPHIQPTHYPLTNLFPLVVSHTSSSVIPQSSILNPRNDLKTCCYTSSSFISFLHLLPSLQAVTQTTACTPPTKYLVPNRHLLHLHLIHSPTHPFITLKKNFRMLCSGSYRIDRSATQHTDDRIVSAAPRVGLRDIRCRTIR